MEQGDAEAVARAEAMVKAREARESERWRRLEEFQAEVARDGCVLQQFQRRRVEADERGKGSMVVGMEVDEMGREAEGSSGGGGDSGGGGSGDVMEDVAAEVVEVGVRGGSGVSSGGKKKGKTKGAGAVRKHHASRLHRGGGEQRMQVRHRRMWEVVMPSGWGR